MLYLSDKALYKSTVTLLCGYLTKYLRTFQFFLRHPITLMSSSAMRAGPVDQLPSFLTRQAVSYTNKPTRPVVWITRWFMGTVRTSLFVVRVALSTT